MPHYSIYGLTLASDFPFRWPLQRCDRPADLRFECTSRPPEGIDAAALPRVHSVAPGGPDGVPGITYHSTPGVDVVRIRGVADHYVWPDRIICHLHDEALGYLVEIQLLGMVLALWLERRHVLVLHGAATVLEGRAVAFLGTKGGGKTTLAAAMIEAGHALRADDLLGIDLEEERVTVRPGYPMLRLWPDQLARFRPEAVGRARRVHPAYEKVRVSLDGRPGTFSGVPAELARLYLPVRSGGSPVEVERIGPAEAMMALVRHSYLRDAIDGLGLSGLRLEWLAEICRRVPVARLRLPHGLERLPEAVAMVERDLRCRASARPFGPRRPG